MQLAKTQESQKRELLTQSIQGINGLIQISSQGGKLLSSREVVSMGKMLSGNTMSVGYLRKQGEETEKQIVALYVLAIAEASKLFPNSFDSNSITDTAFMLMNEYPELKPEEIIIILKNGIAGKYGKMYHAISCAAIMEWAINYFEERSVWFENQVMNKGREDNSKKEDIVVNPELIEKTKKLAESLAIPKYKPNEIKVSERDKLIQDLFREHFLLNTKQTKEGQFKFESPIAFVRYNDKVMDATEYVQTRLREENK